jgi:hypothetical protein
MAGVEHHQVSILALSDRCHALRGQQLGHPFRHHRRSSASSF